MPPANRALPRPLAARLLFAGAIAVVCAAPAASALHAQQPQAPKAAPLPMGPLWIASGPPPGQLPSTTDVLVRILEKDWGYRLDEGVVLRRIVPPYSWARQELANIGFRREPQEMLAEGERTAMGFVWNSTALRYQTVLKTEAPRKGAPT